MEGTRRASRTEEPYVPARCLRHPNASADRAFGVFVCNHGDARCHFYGPVYVLDQEGRRYECRKRDVKS
jgi:hypothetical protein